MGWDQQKFERAIERTIFLVSILPTPILATVRQTTTPSFDQQARSETLLRRSFSCKEPENDAVHRLLGILSTFSASFSGLGLDEKVDKEQARKKSSQSDRHVSPELNLQSNRSRGHGFNDGVQSKCWSSNGGNGQCTGSNLAKSLGNWKRSRKRREHELLGNWDKYKSSSKVGLLGKIDTVSSYY